MLFFRRPALAALLIAAAALLVYVSLAVFRNHPACMDEYTYHYQAELFARGHAFVATTERYSPLFERFMVFHDGRLFSKYPPGISLLLAVGIWVHGEGLVNPLISTLTLLLIFWIVEMIAETKVALLTTLLVATNSYFVGYAGSYFAQPLALFTLTLALYLYCRYRRAPSRAIALACGLALGACIITRPLDGLCGLLVISPVIWLQARESKRWHDLIGYGAGAAAGLVALVGYNFYLMHAFSISTYPVWDGEFKVQYAEARSTFDSIRLAVEGYIDSWQQNTVRNFRVHFLPKIGYAFVAAIALGMTRRREKLRYVCLGLFIAFVVLYTFHAALGYPIYGARYWYPTVGALGIVGGLGLDVLKRRPVILGVFVVLMLGLQLKRLATDLHLYARKAAAIAFLQTDLEAHCPERSIVWLRQPNHPPVSLFDLKRNMDLIGPRYFVITQGEAADARSLFPGYPLCVYVLDRSRLNQIIAEK